MLADASLAVIQAPSIAVPTLCLSTAVAFMVSKGTSSRKFVVGGLAALLTASIPVAVCCWITWRGFGSWIQQVLEQEDMKSPEALMQRFGGKGVFLVAEDAEGTLLGTAAAEATQDERVFELRRMSVSKASQKRGIGKLLIQKLEDELGTGKKQIFLIVSSVQYAAHRLYQSSGFTRTATLEFGIWLTRQGIHFFRYEKNYVCK